MAKKNDLNISEKSFLKEVARKVGRGNKNSDKYKDVSSNINVPSKSSYAVSAAVILSDAAYKPESQLTAFEKMDIAREGVSKRDLEHLKEKSELDYDKLAKALSVTRATLINKQRDEKFGLVLSEKIVSLADLYSYGYEVFENEDKFNQWMFKPNQALKSKTPYDLIDNQFGREEVRNVIGRIDYGVYS